MRIAFVSPLPPAPTGIADYASDVLALLATGHEVEAFHDQEAVDTTRLPGACRVLRAERLAARHAKQRFDVFVYQMGNAPGHGYLYPLLERFPGLLVLHDLVLHHARARMFLDSPEVRAYAAEPWNAARRAAARAPLSQYAAELRHAYPEQAARLMDAQLGTVGPLLPYAYPLWHRPVEASRVVAVHNEFMAAALREEAASRPVVRIPMPMTRTPVPTEAVAALRARYGLGPNDFVVGCFGLVTPEKRVGTVAMAVARAAVHLPGLRLMLVGPTPDRAGLERSLEQAGVGTPVIVTDRVPFEELPAHMALADLAVHLRYPTARETSAALLRLLAQGRATVISDLEHLADVPEDAVVRVDVRDEEGGVMRAILRLSGRREAREGLGARAAAFVARAHAPACALEGYERALATARTA